MTGPVAHDAPRSPAGPWWRPGLRGAAELVAVSGPAATRGITRLVARPTQRITMSGCATDKTVARPSAPEFLVNAGVAPISVAPNGFALVKRLAARAGARKGAHDDSREG